MGSRERVRIYFVFGLILLSGALVVFGISRMMPGQSYSYNTTVGAVSFDHPYFDQLNAVLFPGYDVKHVVVREDIPLYEVNEFSTPTVLLPSGPVLSVFLPPRLLAHLVRSSAPDVIILGSSTCREAFRADVFSEKYQANFNVRPKVLNLCVNQGAQQISEKVLDFVIRNASPNHRFKLVMIMVDAHGLNWRLNTLFNRVATRWEQYFDEIERPPLMTEKQWLPRSVFEKQKQPAVNRDGEMLSAVLKDKQKLQSEYERFCSSAMANGDRRFNRWRVGEDSLNSFDRLLAKAVEHSDGVVVMNAVTTICHQKIFGNRSSFPEYQVHTQKAGATYIDLTQENTGLTNNDFYYAKRSDTFDLDHLNALGAIKLTNAIADLMMKLSVTKRASSK